MTSDAKAASVNTLDSVDADAIVRTSRREALRVVVVRAGERESGTKATLRSTMPPTPMTNRAARRRVLIIGGIIATRTAMMACYYGPFCLMAAARCHCRCRHRHAAAARARAWILNDALLSV